LDKFRTQKSDIPESTTLAKAIKISLIKQNVTKIHIPSKLFGKNRNLSPKAKVCICLRTLLNLCCGRKLQTSEICIDKILMFFMFSVSKENLCSFVGGWMDRYLKGIENQMKNFVMARNLLDTFDR